MSEWREVTLGDVATNLNRRRVPLSKRVRAERRGPFPYYGAQGIVDHVDDFIFDGRYLLVAEDGENLRSRKAPVARIAAGRFWVNNHAHILEAKPGNSDITFLLHATNQAPLSGLITGAAQPKLTKAALMGLRIPCPDFLTQRRIAAVLSAFDEQIEINERRIRVLEDLTHIQFEDLLSSDENSNWEIKEIGDVADLLKGSLKPSDAPATVFEHFSIPAFDTGQIPTLEEGREIRSSKYKVPSNCVLQSKLNPRIPRVWFAEPASDLAVASTEFLVWTGTRVPNSWLWALLGHPTVRATLSGAAGGTSTSHQRVKPADVAGMVRPIPPEPDLARFDETAGNALKEANALRRQNRQLAATRDLLLPRLVTGRLDISEVDLGVLTPAEVE